MLAPTATCRLADGYSLFMYEFTNHVYCTWPTSHIFTLLLLILSLLLYGSLMCCLPRPAVWRNRRGGGMQRLVGLSKHMRVYLLFAHHSFTLLTFFSLACVCARVCVWLSVRVCGSLSADHTPFATLSISAIRRWVKRIWEVALGLF